MISKIVLTLEQDEERGTNEAMEETVAILATLDVMPMMKLVLTLECEEIAAERYRAILRTALRERPIGIIAKFKTTTEEEVTRMLMSPVTPMDRMPGFRDSGDEPIDSTGAKVLSFLEAREQS